MPRRSREKSETGIYHIMLRGIDKQQIFMDDKDNNKFIEAVKNAKGIGNFKLYAYCLMKNHVHLLIKEGEEDIGKSIQRVAVSYVRWHNDRYARVGHLFQNRFRSEPVNTEDYLLTVCRYIHQNPLKANMVKKISDYSWSSYRSYFEHYNGNIGLIDTELITSFFKTRRAFEIYMNETNEDKCLEFTDSQKYTDDELRKVISDYYNICKIAGIKDRNKQNSIIANIYEETGASIRQLSRVLELGKSIVENATKKDRRNVPMS